MEQGEDCKICHNQTMRLANGKEWGEDYCPLCHKSFPHNPNTRTRPDDTMVYPELPSEPGMCESEKDAKKTKVFMNDKRSKTEYKRD